MKYYILAFKNYAVFSGRTTRQEFWMFFLFNLMFSIGFNIIDRILGTTYVYYSGNIPITQGYISGLYNLVLLIPGLAAQVRRLHDVNKSGWLLLLILIPVIGCVLGAVTMSIMIIMLMGLVMLGFGIWILVLLCTPGTNGPNKYGEDPNGGGFKFSFEEEGSTPTEE